MIRFRLFLFKSNFPKKALKIVFLSIFNIILIDLKKISKNIKKKKNRKIEKLNRKTLTIQIFYKK